MRIGPKMAEVVDFVRRNPGCTKLAAAEHVGPNGSRQFGYRSVNRAIRAGLVTARQGTRRGKYALEVAS